MTKIIKSKSDNFTITNNQEVRDANLSWKARGIFQYLWSQHDDWNFYETEVAKHAPDGRDSLRSGLKELKRIGYLKQKRERDSKGVLRKTKWILSDKPMLDNPTLDKPTQENPTLSNTNLSNIKGSNTDKGNGKSSKESKSSSNANQMSKVSRKAQQVFGLNIRPTDYERLSNYQSDLDADLMLKAFDIAENNKAHSIKYVFSILTKWAARGYHSLDNLQSNSTQGREKQDDSQNSTQKKHKTTEQVKNERENEEMETERKLKEQLEGRNKNE